MNVFIGGSIGISKLNAAIRARLDDFMKRGNAILIGDANGADKAVQTYLATRDYRNVTVFCMEECRNNIGAWPTRSIEAPTAKEGFQLLRSERFCDVPRSAMRRDAMGRKEQRHVAEHAEPCRGRQTHAGLLRAEQRFSRPGERPGFAGSTSPLPAARPRCSSA